MKTQFKCRRKSNLGSYSEGNVMKAKHYDHHSKHKSAEVTAYLNELQSLVPFMPKNKTLSKLEVISNVIEYIHDLRDILGLSSCDVNCDMKSTVPIRHAENQKRTPGNKVKSTNLTLSETSMSPAVTYMSSLSHSEPSH